MVLVVRDILVFFFVDQLSFCLFLVLTVNACFCFSLTMISNIMADAAEEAGVAPSEPGVPTGVAAVSPMSEHSYGSFGSAISMEEAM